MTNALYANNILVVAFICELKTILRINYDNTPQRKIQQILFAAGQDCPNYPQKEVLFVVFEKVKNILAAQFDVDEESITMDTDILEDLGADSLDVMDLMMTLGDEFDMQVDESEIENITTVGALVNFIEANS